jgi:hypothetical protein
MVQGGIIPTLVELLKKPQYRARGLRLLYHIRSVAVYYQYNNAAMSM